MSGNLDEARRIFAETIATYEELDLHFRQATRGVLARQFELTAGNPDAAEHELRSGVERCDALGAQGFAASLRGLLANLLWTRGRLDEAEALARELSTSTPEDGFGRRCSGDVCSAACAVTTSKTPSG